MMIKKIKNFFHFNKIKIKEENEWLLSPPIARTLPGSRLLPYPAVCQPTVEQINGEVPDFPAYIAVEITNVCNLQCVHCNYRYGLDH